MYEHLTVVFARAREGVGPTLLEAMTARLTERLRGPVWMMPMSRARNGLLGRKSRRLPRRRWVAPLADPATAKDHLYA